MRAQFAISAGITQQDGQVFLFDAHKVATTHFALQADDSSFPAYGLSTTAPSRSVTLPAAQIMHADAANPRPIVAANDFKTTNLNGCAWLPSSHVIIIPKEDPFKFPISIC